VKSDVEHVEYREQPLAGARRALLDLGFQPAARPHRFPPVQKGHGQIVFGAEMVI
jgi:hypothetical protein